MGMQTTQNPQESNQGLQTVATATGALLHVASFDGVYTLCGKRRQGRTTNQPVTCAPCQVALERALAYRASQA